MLRTTVAAARSGRSILCVSVRGVTALESPTVPPLTAAMASANVVLGAVRPEEEGQASGANNAIRELGGVFGVAVLASVFSHYGGYQSGASFVDGLTPAVWIGAALVGVGALAALAIQETLNRLRLLQ